MSEEPQDDSFEQALERLEESVEQLESGDLNLAEALDVFEQGIAASRACTQWLDQTRKRVQVLIAESGGDFRLSFLDPVDDLDEEEIEDE